MIPPLTLFISDLHLEPEQPRITEIFLQFLSQDARKAEALYILGDFFEAWMGDDDINDFHFKIISALKKVADSGVKIYLMRGNRDFFLGKRFAQAAGATLIPDPTLINLYGQNTLLMHGDSLCTFDWGHQLWRRFSLNPFLQKLALTFLPLKLRRKIGRSMRQGSRNHQSNMADYKKDVAPHTVTKMMEQYQVKRLIHGHTHKPGFHTYIVNGQDAQRIVLGAWHHEGNALFCSPESIDLKTISLDI